MLNVNKITSMLAKMPDPQLQQYAQMHKNDPYIMALAMSESNRRKEVRAVKPPMAEQPKVVDQEIAQMGPQQLPEDQGIGQLPAGNMNFANGGIIAFADGGDVERYQSQGLVQPQFGGSLSADFSGFGGPTPEQQAAAEIRAAEEANLRQIADLEQKTAFLKSAGAPQAQAAQAQLDALKASMRPKPSPTDPNFRRQTDPRLLGTSAVSSAVPLITSGPIPAPGTKPAAPGGKPAAPAEDKSASGLDALTSKFTRETDLAQGELRNQRAGLRSLLEQEATDEAAAVKKRIKDEGDVFAKKEGRLAEREKGITGMQDQNLGLALLQAGASIMTTPGNIGMAIGEGVKVGSKSYIAGIDKINAAKEKFADARDRLDDLRLNRSDMNNKEIQAAERAIRTSRIQGQQLLLDGATNDLKISNDNQRAIFTTAADAIQTDKRLASAEKLSKNEIAARERIAQIPQGQERIASLLGKGNLEVGLAKFAEIQAGKFNPTTAYTDYISKRKEGDTVLTPQEFVTQIRSIQALMAKAPPTTVDTSKPDRQ